MAAPRNASGSVSGAPKSTRRTATRRAQDAGAVRADLTTAELHAVVAGVLVMEQRLPAAAKGKGLAVVADGLSSPPTPPGRTAGSAGP
ncbi:hypothetical protein ABZS66_61350 [Dactylosporangium sp. NPDC005572]|uniref:SbtR family transcriptional regulator n=1 Tax=Dactylosporangium sp. NPDC005572 TaxID=3156889 RepID=UPI0033A569C9